MAAGTECDGRALVAAERGVQFSAPTWLRNLGFSSWLLTGFVLIIFGVVWLLGQTSMIVMPVILAAVIGAVAGPAVTWMEHHGIPRIWGAILVLLALVAIGVLVFCLVVGGVSANSGDISTKVNHALDKVQSSLNDLGVETQQAKESVQQAAPDIRKTLLGGVAHGIQGLSTALFFLAFATLSTLFVLKDGPVMRAFINRHLTLLVPVAEVVTKNIARSLRSYFLAVTIIAAFNGVVIGGAALLLGVIQPLVMGAALSLNPLVVLVVTIGAGALFGMVGLTLAAPLTSAGVHIANELRAQRSGSRRTEQAPAPSG